MSQTIRFPFLAPTRSLPTERALLINLIVSQPTLPRGGGPFYGPIGAWKINANGTEVPFPCVVIEFLATANANFTIGDGSVPIGLYGGITDSVTAITFRTLIGILGVNIGGTNNPVIPLDADANGDAVGYSQIVSNVGCYDTLSVGGVGAAIDLPGANQVSVRLRPIIRRDWMG